MNNNKDDSEIIADDFGELKNDEKFVNLVQSLDCNLDNIEKSILMACSKKDDEEEGRSKLSAQEKVKLDNYLLYTVNSLYRMYVKLQGMDPNEHGIKNELNRVRSAMERDKEIHERNTIRPVLDKRAAGRFIQHGLHIRFNEDGEETAGS